MDLIEPVNCDELLEVSLEKGEQQHSHPKSTWRLITMIVLNSIFFLAELIVGFISKSLSLQSDAFHMLSDIASLIIGLVAHRLSKDLPTSKMTFGWSRTEVLGGLINSVFLLAICLTLFFSAIERFFEVKDIQQPMLFFIVGSLGLFINIVGLFVFHDHSHSDNLAGVFLHVLGDFLGSIGVVISACVVTFTDWKYKMYVDPAISILIVIVLALGSSKLFIKTSKIVIERCPEKIDYDKIKNELLEIPSIICIHELHIWELCKENYIALAHIIIDSKENYGNVLQLVHNKMINNGIYSTTVQCEFADDFPSGVDKSDSCLFSSSVGKKNRAFVANPVYEHLIGCPHLMVDDSQESITDNEANPSSNNNEFQA
ncbi:cation efflux family protein [Histomonas meleagridis]|uniref:cation efflux family protein n=1 Tax=Histomonas meleagridis TaxID=135588 RepID=UPI00355A4F86|nr:cation efflux family protein [Histomonas meleagridis]KAH0796608.1 cation efflux family protein [Histomonas meleagridis]